MMNHSANVFILRLQPDIKIGTKCSKVEAIQEVEFNLRTMEIKGLTQINQAGLDGTNNQFFSKQGPKGKRDMVIEEISNFGEEQ